MELGLATFADLAAGVSPEQRMTDLIEEATLADELGLDVFAIGEHHREDFLISSPAVPLAAAAVLTKRIRLSSAVTVLSSDDPVRVFQDFAQVDLLSGGRAEIMAGRGSFVESFPLFGLDLDDYDELYAEKLDLLLGLRERVHLTWSGRHRPALNHAGVYPRPVQECLPVWVAVGGSPQSAIRAGTLGLPLTLAIIGGQPERFAPLVRLYREALAQDVTLSWKTFSDAADEAGISRRYGGIQFVAGDLDGRAMGRKIGAQAWSKAQEFVKGTA